MLVELKLMLTDAINASRQKRDLQFVGQKQAFDVPQICAPLSCNRYTALRS